MSDGITLAATTFLFSSLNQVPVTVMVERRMVRDTARAAAYREYQRTTGCWLPWPAHIVQTLALYVDKRLKTRQH